MLLVAGFSGRLAEYKGHLSHEALRLLISQPIVDARHRAIRSMSQPGVDHALGRIVICLVNLRDFVGEADAARKTDNQAVIMSALRMLAGDSARSSLLAVYPPTVRNTAVGLELSRSSCPMYMVLTWRGSG